MVTARPIGLDDVAVFVKVASTGGFSRAALALGLPKSSVSRAVARLEDSLGVRLIERTTRQMRLTHAGSDYFDQVQRALQGLDDAADSVRQLQTEPRGQLRVTAPVDLGQIVLAPLCVAFLRQHPGIDLEMVLTDRVVDLVDEGLDLAIRAGDLRDSSLVARRLGTSQLALFAGTRWLAQHSPPRHPDELRQLPAVLFRNRTGETALRLRGPQGMADAVLRGQLSCNNFLFLRAALIEGAGIGVLPTLVARDDVAAGRLQRLLPEWTLDEGPLWAVYPSTRHLPLKVRAFIDFLLDQLATGEVSRRG